MNKNRMVDDYILTNAKRNEIIELLGGCCSECGESDIACMTTHHIDRKTKIINLSDLYKGRFSNTLKEANKCILLCRNCHCDIHTTTTLTCRQRRKNRLLDAVGKHACEECGYSKNLGVLVFHHIDPSTKLFTISHEMMYSRQVDLHIEEAHKCKVLCQNCHSKVHFDYVRYNDNLSEIMARYSSYVERPDRVDESSILADKKAGMSNVDIANKLGCAKSTITGILKKYGMSTSMENIKISQIEISKIEELFLLNVSVGDIAKEIGRNRSVVVRYTRELKKIHGRRNINSPFSNKFSETYIKKDDLIHHLSTGISLRAISRIYGCSHHIIRRKLVEYALK